MIKKYLKICKNNYFYDKIIVVIFYFQFMNFIQNSNLNQSKQIEVWANPEQKEQFDKNSQEFKSKYEQKLKNILPEDLVWKISGSFELSWDINSQIINLKNNWLSEESINFIKNYLNENISIPKDKLDQITKEIENFSSEKNLDFRFWNVIWKASRKAEETNNDELFNKVIEARNIQKNWNLNEKAKILIELENIILRWDNNFLSEEKNNLSWNEIWNFEQKENNYQTLSEVWVENEDVWNDKWVFEEWALTWDLLSKDKQPESNDYWNIKVEKKETLLQKWLNILKPKVENNWEKLEKQENFSETNWEYFSILENLSNLWEISEEQFNSINKDLSWKSSQEQKSIFKNFIEKLPDSENKTNILENFNENKEKITEENFDKSTFSNDLKWKIDLDKSIWWLELMLAENYIYMWNKDSWQEKNITQNLNSSMEVTKAKIIKSKSVDFKNNNAELISEISSEKNLDVKYQKLKQLYKEGLKEDAKAWWTKWKEEMDRKKEDLIWQYRETLEKIKEAEKSWNKEELEKLNKQKLQIEKEAKETQDLIEELDKITKETDLDVWVILSENNEK